MVYTLEYLKKEAEQIAGDWNGEDERFVSGGETFFAEHAQVATELLEKIKEIKVLATELGI